jgi:5'-methylthioadenosine/S-adenosylhomocysteine nucleosidase
MADKQKCLIFLMNRWLSAAGGIQTVNRELACAAAKEAPFLNCVAVVADAGQEEREHAFRNGVRLIHGRDEKDWTSALLSPELATIQDLDVVGVIGHSYFSGQQAILLRDRFFPGALAIQFIHMSPLDTESVKEYRTERYVQEREEKVRRELEIAEKSDLVFCIGPRLWAYCRDQLAARRASPEVIQLNCGIKREPERSAPPVQPTLLCLGRTDSKNIKGLDIFAYAAGNITKMWREHPSTKYRAEPQFFVRGAKEDSGTLETWLTGLAEQAGAAARIRVRPYTTKAEELVSDYLNASLFMMPSREEGFGLVACEALSLGVPILISECSGFADVVRQQARESAMSISECVVQHRGAAGEIGMAYARAALEILVDQGRAETYAHHLRERMMESCSWTGAAANLLAELHKRSPMLGLAAAGRPRADKAATPFTSVRSAPVPLDELYPELKQPGVIASSLRQAIMVIVEKGSDPKIPARLGSMDVIVREVDGVQFTSVPEVCSGDALLLAGRSVARVGVMVTDPLGNVYWTTAAHAVSDDTAKPYLIESRSGSVEARVQLVERRMDIAFLKTSHETPVQIERHPAGPLLGMQVVILSGDRFSRGVITGVNANGEFGGSRYSDLFEVQVASGSVMVGDSGCLVVEAATMMPVGLIVSLIRDPRAGYDTVYSASLDRALRELGLRLLDTPLPGQEASSDEGVQAASTTPRGSTVAILADSAATMTHLSRAMPSLRREAFGQAMYFTGELGPRQTRIVAATIETTGNLAAAVVASKILRDVRPDYLFVVGIAGGVNPEVHLGDVVVSSEVIYYEPARLSEDQAAPRSRVLAVTPRWLSSLAKESLSDSELGTLPTVRIGPIASGEKLISGAGRLAEVLGDWPALAIEMEGAGVAEAASTSEVNAPVVVIRGISDIIAARKTKTDHSKVMERAAEAAVKVALGLAGRVPLPKDRISDSDSELVASREYTHRVEERLKIDPSIGQVALQYGLGEAQREVRAIYVRRRLLLQGNGDQPSLREPGPVYTDELLDQPGVSVIITGGPGTGKTSLCRFHASRDAQRFQSGDGSVLPVYIPLNRFSYGPLPASLIDMGGAEVAQAAKRSQMYPVKFYLDGLDEIHSAGRRAEVLGLVNRAALQQGSVVLTSRARSEEFRGLGIPVFALASFSRADFSALANRWLERADALVEQVSRIPQLEALTGIPLFATLLVLVFRGNGTLPANRARIYQVMLDLLAGDFDRAKGLIRSRGFGAVVKLSFLRRLALELQLLRKRTCTQDELSTTARRTFGVESLAMSWPQLIDEVVDDGLLVREPAQEYAFFHLSFQEFLAAQDLVGGREETLQTKVIREYLLGDLWWRETLQFCIELDDNGGKFGGIVAATRDKLLHKAGKHANTIRRQARTLLSENDSTT